MKEPTPPTPEQTVHPAATVPWYRQRWPWLLIVPPLAAVIGGVVTLTLAIRSDDGVVVADYYKRGLAINAELSRSQRATELGLQAEVKAGGESTGDSVWVRVSGEQPLPAEAALRIRLVHPGRGGADRVAILSRVAAGDDGRSAEYRGAWDEAVELHVPVAWRVLLEGRQWRLDGQIAAGGIGGFRLAADR
jgi:hypothetical protein